MAEYVKGTSRDKADIVDFGNYVFSQAHRPHNFKTLLPKGYADEVDISDCHYLAKQEGKIRAMVACLPMTQEIFGHSLRFGLVGTVSVHPYARSEGHMKRLMHMMIEDQRAQGVDLLALGGQRQRYNYFGFERTGLMIHYDISAASMRHGGQGLDTTGLSFAEITREDDPLLDQAFDLYQAQPITGARPRERFLCIMHSWTGRVYAVLQENRFAGFVYTAGSGNGVGEILLKDEALLPAALKAWMEEKKPERMTLSVAPYDKKRMALVKPLSETCSVGGGEMLCILNWPRVLCALMNLKAQYQPLEPGTALLCIDGEKLRVTVAQDGGISVVPEEGTPDLTLSHLEAERAFFDMEQIFAPALPCLKNWAPLPFVISSPDSF